MAWKYKGEYGNMEKSAIHVKNITWIWIFVPKIQMDSFLDDVYHQVLTIMNKALSLYGLMAEWHTRFWSDPRSKWSPKDPLVLALNIEKLFNEGLEGHDTNGIISA